MDEPWDDKVFFASAESSKNLTPTSTSPRYDVFATENLPKYDPETCELLPTSVPPFHSKYSDMRTDLGYMSGAMESGRYAAHRIAASLGLPNRLPTRLPAPPQASFALPALSEPSAVTADHAAAVLAELKSELLGPGGSARIEGFRRAGLGGEGGFAAYLRELLAKTLSASGQPLSATDPAHAPSLLRHLRDFAMACAEHVQAVATTTEAGEAIRAHVDELDRALGSRP